jgi:hypothetical protein
MSRQYPFSVAVVVRYWWFAISSFSLVSRFEATLSSLIANPCEGHWQQLDHEPNDYHISASRTPFLANKANLSIDTFIKEACPAQVALYTCYFSHDDQARSKRIERMSFVADNDEQCRPFFPAEFLRLLRNRRVLFHGDSTSGQLWTSLVCSLYHIEESYVHTAFWGGGECHRSRRCPVEPLPDNQFNPLHAYLSSGYINFRHSNTSLIHYAENHLQSLPTHVRNFALGPEDVVVVGHGLHNSEPKPWASEIEGFRRYLEEQLLGTDSVHAPLYFVLHSTPQHFDSSNGYFDFGDQAHMSKTPCVPLARYNESTDRSRLYVNDWRNQILEKELSANPFLLKKLTVIPISLGLNSRFDAHPPVHDCTHWCFPGGIYKYLHRQLFAALSARLSVFSSVETVVQPSPVAVNATIVVVDRWKTFPGMIEGRLFAIETPGHRDPLYYVFSNGKICRCVDLNRCESLGYHKNLAISYRHLDLGPIEHGPDIV